ncbi:MAG TPA: redoxin family protein [Pirellulales bacterium]|nr:redoxin family protein [Pirellulales bacterium]
MRRILAGLLAFACAAIAGPLLQGADETRPAAKPHSREIPDGSPQDLLKYIEQLQEAKPEGATFSARQADARRILANIAAAAQKIIAAKADDATTAAAVRFGLQAWLELYKRSDADAGEKLNALIAKLASDKRPKIAQTAKYYRLLREQADLDVSSEDDVKAFVAKAKKFLLGVELDPSMAVLGADVVQMQRQSEGSSQAVETARSLALAFAGGKNPKAAIYASDFSIYAGRTLIDQDKPKEARKIYEQAAALLEKSDDEDVVLAREKLQGMARQLDLIGQAIEIRGTLLNGKRFDWSKYKGKVVLVDFWATWCEPCIEELPNVKEAYRQYHDRGFEVVGISLDEERETLEGFVKQAELPWPILFSADPKALGWEHPMARYYGVSSLPTTILVDRQGKAVSLHARGEDLGELVADLLRKTAAEKPSKTGKAAKP